MQDKPLWQEIDETIRSFGSGFIAGVFEFFQGILPGRPRIHSGKPKAVDKKNGNPDKIKRQLQHPTDSWKKLTKPRCPGGKRLRDTGALRKLLGHNEPEEEQTWDNPDKDQHPDSGSLCFSFLTWIA